MLESNPEFREWMKTQVTVMAIDEAQDLTELNYLILDRLIEIVPGLKYQAFSNPDGSTGILLLNESDGDLTLALRRSGRLLSSCLSPARSIVSVLVP